MYILLLNIEIEAVKYIGPIAQKLTNTTRFGFGFVNFSIRLICIVYSTLNVHLTLNTLLFIPFKCNTNNFQNVQLSKNLFLCLLHILLKLTRFTKNVKMNSTDFG